MNELGLIARLRNEASRELRDLRGDVRDFDREVDRTSSTSQKAGRNWGSLVGKASLLTGGLAAAGLAAKQAYEFISAGADLRATEERFDRLSASIGTTADALRSDLKDATGGLMSNAALVSSATELMNLGLVKSHDETVRLASVAGQLNWDMQVLGLTLANNSTARLDSLGLSMEVVKEKADRLVAAGHSMDEAFDLAVIEAGEEKVELLGDAAETQAGKMQTLKSRWDNFISSLKEFSSEAADPAVDALVGITTPIGEISFLPDDIETQLDQLMRTTSSLEEFKAAAAEITNPDAAVGHYMRNLTILYEETSAYTNSLDDLRRRSMDVTRATAEQVEETTALDRVTGSWAGSMASANPYLEEHLDNIQRTNEARAESAERLRELNRVMGQEFVEQVNAGSDALFTINEATGGITANSDAMADSLFNAAAAAGADAGQLALLGVATGKFSEEQAKAFLKAAALQVKIEELGEAIAGGMSIDDAMEKFKDFQAEIENTDGDLRSMATATGLVNDGLDQLDGREVRMRVTTEWNNVGQPPNVPGMPGGPAGGGTPYEGTGEGHGSRQDYATGGYTGDGPANRIAGRVHGQEYVLRAPAVRALGGPGVLDEVNATGRFPGGPSVVIQNIDARGATDPQGTARAIRAEVEQVLRQHARRVDHGGRI